MALELDAIYNARFDAAEVAAKDAMWAPLVQYLSRYFPEAAAVLDVGCDRGHFIKQVQAGDRWASDVRDVRDQLPADISFVQTDGLKLASCLPHDHFDVAFMSNYLEHLPTSDAVIAQFSQVREVLKPHGLVMVLQPNVRLIGGRYWDFIDHRVALTERSLVEAAGLAGFRTRHLVTRFLPYTTKSRLLPSRASLVRAYLALRPVWFLLGKQTLYIGERR